MKIYFIRHGETEYNKAGRMSGHSEALLTEEGKEQVQKAAAELPNDLDYIYSSDLIRCKHTTEILNHKLKLPVFYDARLRERNLGKLEGTTWKDFLLTSPERDDHGQYDFSSVGGESSREVKDRIMACIHDIKKEKKGEKILVVTSGGIISLLHHIFNKSSPSPEKIHNSSIHEFEFPEM